MKTGHLRACDQESVGHAPMPGEASHRSASIRIDPHPLRRVQDRHAIPQRGIRDVGRPCGSVRWATIPLDASDGAEPALRPRRDR
jgi:hypothetical protein